MLRSRAVQKIRSHQNPDEDPMFLFYGSAVNHAPYDVSLWKHYICLLFDMIFPTGSCYQMLSLYRLIYCSRERVWEYCRNKHFLRAYN